MLKPHEQQQQQLLLPVFGKPWYWQRTSGIIDSTRSLAHVILEMREEIKKLEAENRELRGDCDQTAEGEGSRESQAEEQVVENPYGPLRRNVSAPVLDDQMKDNTVMTVRRYSINSSLTGVSSKETRPDGNLQTDSGWGRLQDAIHHHHNNNSVLDPSTGLNGAKASSRHSLQEYVHKNRAKVKTVSFLLPVDDIYTNRPVLTRPDYQTRIKELTPITETDSCNSFS